MMPFFASFFFRFFEVGWRVLFESILRSLFLKDIVVAFGAAAHASSVLSAVYRPDALAPGAILRQCEQQDGRTCPDGGPPSIRTRGGRSRLQPVGGTEGNGNLLK